MSQVGVLSCRHETCNFIKEETPTQEFCCKVWDLFELSLFYKTLPVAAFEAFYLHVFNMKHNKLYRSSFQKNKIKETSNNSKYLLLFLIRIICERRYLAILKLVSPFL